MKTKARKSRVPQHATGQILGRVLDALGISGAYHVDALIAEVKARVAGNEPVKRTKCFKRQIRVCR